MGDVWLAPSSAGLVFGDGSTSPPYTPSRLSSEGHTAKKIYSQADANEWLLFDDVGSAGAQLLALQAERARLDAQIAAGEDHMAALHFQSEGGGEDGGYGGDMAVPASQVQEDGYTYIVNAEDEDEDEDDNEPSYGYNDGSSALQKEGVSGASLLAGLSKRGGGSGVGADGSAMEEERGDVGVGGGGGGGGEWQRGGIEGYSETGPAKYADVYAVLRDAWGDTADGGANDGRGGGEGGGSGDSNTPEGFRTSIFQFDFNMDKAEMAAGEAKAKAKEAKAKMKAEAKAKMKAEAKAEAEAETKAGIGGDAGSMVSSEECRRERREQREMIDGCFPPLLTAIIQHIPLYVHPVVFVVSMYGLYLKVLLVAQYHRGGHRGIYH